MFKTALQDLLGIEQPLLGGTMMDLSLPPFVAAISEAGALGILPSASFQDYDEFRGALVAIKGATDKPFAVNINLFPMMKKLDNMRASGKDDNPIITPARKPTIESALEWIEDDELLEVTPDTLRLRKKLLGKSLRKR